MTTHPRVRLDRLASTIESGFPCGKRNLVENGLLHLRPFNVGSNGDLVLDQEYQVPFEIAPQSKTSLCAGDILFNNTNSPALVGKVAMIRDDIEASYSNHLTRIRVDSTRCEPEFLAAHMRLLWLHGYFRDNCTQWVSQAAFGPRLLRSIQIPLPPLDEQRRIVGILNRAAKIERLRKQAQERLREFVPALFVKMFGDPVKNPKNWTSEPLGNLIREGPQNGLYKPKSVYGSGTPILRIDGFYDGNVTDPVGWQRLCLDEKTVKKYALAEDDIVINRVNSRPFLGKSAIIPKIDEPAVFESNMMRMRLDSNRILPRFLISMLQIKSAKGQLCANAKDAINQSSINQTDVCGFSVPVPPLELQCRYTLVTEIARSAVAVTESGSRTASELSASLMSRLLV